MSIGAGDDVVHRDSLSLFPSVDAAPQADNLAGKFMAHHLARRPPTTFTGVAVNVAAANATGFHPKLDFPRAGGRLRKIGQAQLMRSAINESFHEVDRPFFERDESHSVL